MQKSKGANTYLTVRFVRKDMGIVLKDHIIVEYGMLQHGTVRYGTVRYGTVRYGTVRHGTVPFLITGMSTIKSDQVVSILRSR